MFGFYCYAFIHFFICSIQARIQGFLEKTKNFGRNKIMGHSQEDLSEEKEILRKRVKNFIRKKRISDVQKLLKNEEVLPWGRDTQAKVCDNWLNSMWTFLCLVYVLDFGICFFNVQLGSRLLELLIETAYVQTPVNQSADCPPDVRPAFQHKFKAVAKDPG